MTKLILVLSLLPLMLTAKVDDLIQSKLRVQKFRFENEAREEISQVLEKKTDLQAVLEIEFLVNIEKIKDELGLSSKGLNILNSSLPGLDDQQRNPEYVLKYWIPEERYILNYLRGIKVLLKTGSTLNQEQKEFIMTLIQGRFRSLENAKVEVEFQILGGLPSSASPADSTSQAIADLLKVEREVKFPREILLGLTIFGGIVLVLLFFMAVSLFGLGRKIANGLQINADSLGQSSPTFTLPEIKFPEFPAFAPGIGHEEEIHFEKWKGLFENPQTLGEVVEFLCHSGAYGALYQLMEILGVEGAKKVQATLKREQLKSYQGFIQHLGFDDQEGELIKGKKELVKILRVFESGTQGIVLYKLKKIFEGRELKEIFHLVSEFNDKELGLVLAHLETKKSSELLRRFPQLLEGRKRIDINAVLSETELKSLNQKLSLQPASPEREKDLLHLVHSLPSELEDKLGVLLGMEGGSFLDLIKNNKTKISQYLLKLDLDSARALLAIIPEGEREQYLVGLPEIKARRIRARGFDQEDRSYELKGQLIEFLKSA